MQLALIAPQIDYKESYLSYIKELGTEERYPFPLDFDHTDFSAMLNKIEDFNQGINLPDGYVPSSTYWLVADGEILGVSNLRHYLNERIRQVGGHVGLGIRPSVRNQGLSKELLKLTLSKAKEKGIHEIHLHCYKQNIASARMIIACGGSLDSEIKVESTLVQRFIIKQ